MAKLKVDAFRAEMAALSESLRRSIEVDCKAFPADAKNAKERAARVQSDFVFFRKTYFPHYVRKKDGAETGDSVLHTWLDETLPALVDNREGVKLACAAPRGEAKTTFVDVFFLLWCLVTGRKRYILIIADAFEQAASFLEAVKVELESNPRLLSDFPEHCGEGRVWNVGTAITAQNVKIQAFSAGRRMRGLRHGPHRPDLALLDDLENDENVRSPEQRDKLEAWLLRTVLSLGPADDSMDVVYIGTILHYDSVLARVLKKPQWQGKTFRAIMRMPNRMDLWESWEALYKTPPDGPEKARKFYDKNRKKMEAGAQISWPAFRPLYTLMQKRAEDRAAFDAEQQNDPLAQDAAPFSAVINFWHELPDGLLYFGACDPSLGKAGAGRDPSALLIGALHRKSLSLYVIEASIKKRHPDRIIQDIIHYQRRHHCLVWAVETVQFQEFFADVLLREAAAAGVPLPIRAIKNVTDKMLRIESLQPYFAQKRIFIHPDQTVLADQLRHFPLADHDDGPDALEMLWRVAQGSFISISEGYVRTPRARFGRACDYDDDDEGSWT